MSPEEILELVKDGVIESGDIEDFENLDDWAQELVANGVVDIDPVRGF